MQTLCLLIALLSSATIGLVEAKTPHPGWEDFPSVLAANRVMVTVVSIPSDSALIVYVRDRGYLLLGKTGSCDRLRFWVGVTTRVQKKLRYNTALFSVGYFGSSATTNEHRDKASFAAL